MDPSLPRHADPGWVREGEQSYSCQSQNTISKVWAHLRPTLASPPSRSHASLTPQPQRTTKLDCTSLKIRQGEHLDLIQVPQETNHASDVAVRSPLVAMKTLKQELATGSNIRRDEHGRL